MENQLVNNLFATIDTLIDKKLEQVKFDETLACTVVKKIEKEDNLYEVKYNNSVIYRALAQDGAEYVENDQVYVSIPRGDYSIQDKIILGKYTASQEQSLSYKDPFEGLIVDKTWNMSFEKNVQLPGGYKTPIEQEFQNIDAMEGTVLFEIENLDTSFSSFFHKQSSLGGYDIMGMEWQFEVSGAADGEVGEWLLALELLTSEKEIISGVDGISPYFIASEEIYGKTSTVLPNIVHRKLFTFPNAIQLTDIDAFRIRVYNRGMSSGTITLHNLTLSFGYDVQKYLSSSVYVFVEGNYNNSFIYTNEQEVSGLPKPNIRAQLIDQANAIIQTELSENQVLRWYQHEIDEQGESYGGGYWKFLGDEFNNFLTLPSNAYTLNINRPNTQVKAVLCETRKTATLQDGNLLGDQMIWQMAQDPKVPEDIGKLIPDSENQPIILYGSSYYEWNAVANQWNLMNTQNTFIHNYWLSQRVEGAQAQDIYSFSWFMEGTEFLGISYYQYDGNAVWKELKNTTGLTLEKIGESTPFIFTNKQSETLPQETNSEIYITTDKTYLPIYNYGNLIGNQVFQLQVFPTAGRATEHWDQLNPTSIVWNLRSPEAGLIEGLSATADGEEWVDYLNLTEEDNYNTIYFKPKHGVQIYDVSRAASTNNIIDCIINDIYRARIEISFGELNAQGTNFSFKIEPKEGQSRFLSNIEDSTRTFKAILTTSDGIELDPRDYNLVWSWEQERDQYYNLSVNENITIYKDVNGNNYIYEEYQHSNIDKYNKLSLNNYIEWKENDIGHCQIRLTKAFSNKYEPHTLNINSDNYNYVYVYKRYEKDTEKWSDQIAFDAPLHSIINNGIEHYDGLPIDETTYYISNRTDRDSFDSVSDVNSYWEGLCYSGEFANKEYSALYYLGPLKSQKITISVSNDI